MRFLCKLLTYPPWGCSGTEGRGWGPQDRADDTETFKCPDFLETDFSTSGSPEGGRGGPGSQLSKYGPQTSSVDIPGESVRNTDSHLA